MGARVLRKANSKVPTDCRHWPISDQTHFRVKFFLTTCDAICAGLEALLEVEALLESGGSVVEHGEVLAEGVRLTVGLATEVVQLVVVRHLGRKGSRDLLFNLNGKITDPALTQEMFINLINLLI